MLTPRKTKKISYALVAWLAVCAAAVLVLPAAAFGEEGGAASEDANQGTAWTIRQNYFKRYKWAKIFGPQTAGGSDNVENGESKGPGTVTVQGPIFLWPKKVQGPSTSQVPTKRDEGITKHLVKTFGYPVSDTQFQAIQRLNDNMMLEEAFDPERWVWMENTMGAVKATSAANSAANLGRNQAAGAIEFAQHFLENFTVDPGNVWNRIRNELFIPMAVLLLLPGAVLAQVRAIVAQGTSLLGDVNPFDGILRSIVAIFLIPATYLVVNYGIDVSNAVAHSISDGYQGIFGSSMYDDAVCAQKRAFPIRPLTQNKNQIPPTGSGTNAPSPTAANDPFSQLESISFDIGAEDPCQAGAGGGGGRFPGGAGGRRTSSDRRQTGQGPSPQQQRQQQGEQSDAPAGTFDSVAQLLSGQTGTQGFQTGGTSGGGGTGAGSPGAGTGGEGQGDEEDPVLKSTQRLVVNGANAGLTATWNVLCAFQMAYLYYLFCIGPVVAALWVWPMQQLRSALPSWVEGVVTLCFWSLFWNTTILLMAAFKGVGETGTIIMTALNFLANSCVKHAFDFAGLVKAAGEQAGKEATKGASGGRGGQRGAEGSGDGATTGTGASGTGTGTGGETGTGTTSTASAGAMEGATAGTGSGDSSSGTGTSGGSPGESSRGLNVGATLPSSDRSGGGSAGDRQGGDGGASGGDGAVSDASMSGGAPGMEVPMPPGTGGSSTGGGDSTASGGSGGSTAGDSGGGLVAGPGGGGGGGGGGSGDPGLPPGTGLPAAAGSPEIAMGAGSDSGRSADAGALSASDAAGMQHLVSETRVGGGDATGVGRGGDGGAAAGGIVHSGGTGVSGGSVVAGSGLGASVGGPGAGKDLAAMPLTGDKLGSAAGIPGLELPPGVSGQTGAGGETKLGLPGNVMADASYQGAVTGGTLPPASGPAGSVPGSSELATSYPQTGTAPASPTAAPGAPVDPGYGATAVTPAPTPQQVDPGYGATAVPPAPTPQQVDPGYGATAVPPAPLAYPGYAPGSAPVYLTAPTPAAEAAPAAAAPVAPVEPRHAASAEPRPVEPAYRAPEPHYSPSQAPAEPAPAAPAAPPAEPQHYAPLPGAGPYSGPRPGALGSALGRAASPRPGSGGPAGASGGPGDSAGGGGPADSGGPGSLMEHISGLQRGGGRHVRRKSGEIRKPQQRFPWESPKEEEE